MLGLPVLMPVALRVGAGGAGHCGCCAPCRGRGGAAVLPGSPPGPERIPRTQARVGLSRQVLPLTARWEEGGEGRGGGWHRGWGREGAEWDGAGD